MIRVAMIGLLVVLTAVLLKNGRSEFALLLSFAGCLLIFTFGVGKLKLILNGISRMKSYLPQDTGYMAVLLKIIGITYVAELASDLCKDAGYAAVGAQVELVGKLSILAVSMPVLLTLLETITQMLH